MFNAHYKNILVVLAVLTVGVFGATHTTFSAFNENINYQGKLTDTNNAAVADGDYDIEFKLYTVPSGGSAIWTETRSTGGGDPVAVTNGLFSVMLGSTTPFTGVDFNQTLYLGINIEGDGEMTPRKVLGAVPAAFEAKQLDGIATSSFLRSDQADTIEATENSSALLTITQNGIGDILNLFDGGTEVFSVLDGGNVGIGTSTPFTTLSVGGDTYIGGNLTATGTLRLTAITDGFLYSDNTGNVTASSTLGSNLIPDEYLRNDGDTTTGDIVFNDNIRALFGTGSDASIYYDGSDFQFDSREVGSGDFIFSGGAVGIGTTSPSAKLSVAGALNFESSTEAVHTFGQQLVGDTGIQWIPDSGLIFKYGSTGAGGDRVAITSAGNVGIGTTSPGANLDIFDDTQAGVDITTRSNSLPSLFQLKRERAGGVVTQTGDTLGELIAIGRTASDFENGAAGIIFTQADADTYAQGNILFNTRNSSDAWGTRMTITSTGNVGIGSTDPSALLEVGNLSIGSSNVSQLLQVGGSASGNNVNALTLGNDATLAVGNAASLTFALGLSTGATAKISGVVEAGSAHTGLTFHTYDGSLSERLRIDRGGNVGIGTTSPYARLSVVGETVSEYFTATSTSATSTLPNLSVTNLLFGSDYINDITGTGLIITAGALTVDDATFFTLSDWYATTTDGLAEGASNFYYTEDRFTSSLAATSSVDSITTLSNLSITESQISDLDHYTTADFVNDLAATTSVDSITTLSNLSITESQISDLSHYTDTDTAAYINASSTIWNNNTEASLEAFLTDATNVFTNNDGALADDDITDDSLEDLSDVATITKNYGDLLGWNGTAWADFATSSLAIALSDTTGTLPVSRGGTGATSLSGLLFGNGTSAVTATTSLSANYLEDVFLRNDQDDTTTGSLTATEFVANDSAATSTFAGGFNVDSGGLLYDHQTGFVGIGTETPDAPLFVSGTTERLAKFYNQGLSDGEKATIRLGQADATNEAFGIEFQQGTVTSLVSMHFFGDAFGSSLVLQKGGNVGIGTTSPFAKLSVAGDTYIGGNLTATGTLAVEGTGTSTIAGNLGVTGDIAADQLFLTGATSTAASGFNITGGCFAVNGTCVGGDSVDEATVEGYIFDGDNSGTLSSGTLALDSLSYTGTLDDTNVNDAITISGGTIGSNSISGTLTTTGTLTIGDGGDRIDVASNSWDVTNGTITGATWNGSTIGTGYGGTGLTSTPTDGQLLIGDGAGYSLATLTESTGINITNGIGSITLAADLGDFDTSDLSESGNLYYTDARVNTLINASSTIWNNNTEASLEAFLTDATNVFTNNDGALADDDITDDSLEDLSDVATITKNYGDLLGWNGTAWADFATSSLAIALSDTTGNLAVNRGGTGTTTFQSGGVIFYDGSTLAQDTNNFFWDNANDRLGLGSSTPTERLTVTGGNIFQAGGDAANQYTPEVVGSTAVSGLPIGISISGNYAYIVTVNNNLFYVVDVSDPRNPEVITSITLGNNPNYVVSSGNYAYVADSSDNTLTVINVSDPASPEVVRTVDVAAIGNMKIVNNYLFRLETGNEDDLEIMDISDPTNPRPISSLNLASLPSYVDVVGEYAYVTNISPSTIQVIDISNPRAPVLVTSGSVPAGATGLSVSGRYAYVTGNGTDDVSVVDLSDQSAPTVVGTASVGVSPGALRSAGGYVYVIDGTDDDMKVIDVRNPENPHVVGQTTTFDPLPRDIQISGRYAYVVGNADELNIIDLTGVETQSLLAHSLEAGSAKVYEDLFVGKNFSVTGGIQTGGGILSQGGGIFSRFAASSLADVFALSGRVIDTNSNGLVNVLNLSHMASSTASDGIGTGLVFSAEDDFGNETKISRIASLFTDNASTTPASALTFANINSAGSLQEFARLDSNGNFGVGTTSPFAKLSVAGDSYLGGNLTATGTLAVQGTGTSTISDNFQVQGNLQVGTSSIYIRSNATSTFDGGIDLSAGCVAVNGTCLGASGGGGATTFTGLTDTQGSLASNRIIYTNSGGTALTDSASFTFDGTSLSTPDLDITGGDITFTGSGSDTITTNQDELVLEQTGDALGTTRLRLQNRVGSAGALFESDDLDLVDFGFAGNTGYQSNLRYEHRSTEIQGGTDDTVGEFQFMDDVLGSFSYIFTTNKSATVVHNGSFGIGTTSPTATLSVAGDAYLGGNVTATGTLDIQGTGTSTAANGFDITDGCYAVNGTCVGTGGGGATAFTGLTDTQGSLTGDRIIFTNSGGTALTDSSSFTFDGTTLATPDLTVSGGDVIYSAAATSTIVNNNAYAWTIATSTSGLPIVRIDTTTTGDFATTSIIGGFDVNNGAIHYDYGANKTSIERLDLGNIEFEGDAGWVSWIDLDISSTPAAGTVQAYSAQIDANELLTVYAEADGSGGLQNTRVAIGTTTASVLSSTNIPWGSLLVSGGILCVDDGGADNCDDSARTPGTIYSEASSVTQIDLAENYPTKDETLGAGDLITLDPENPVFVKKYDRTEVGTSSPESRNFIGVISTKPGVLLGAFGDVGFSNERQVPVTLSGRVPVKVNDEGGNIAVGDRITFSSVAGVGARATTSGMTVGVALEPFATSTASSTATSTPTIEVFVDSSYYLAPAEFFVNEQGYIGIGTTSPQYSLHSAGDIAATGFINTSSSSTKKDIESVEDEDRSHILEVIRNTPVSTYRYNFEDASSTPERLGLIAEEAPSEVLSVNGDGIDLYKLATVALIGVQENDKRLTSIETRLAALEAKASSTPFGLDGGQGGVSAQAIVDWFAQGLIRIADLFVDRLTVGSATQPAGITLYDEVTGDPYCVVISAGDMVHREGECDQLENPPAQAPGGSNPPASGSDGGDADEPEGTVPDDTDDTGTTTPAGGGDTTPPEITINGSESVELAVGESYSDAGAVATDDVDGSLTVSTSGLPIDTTTAGSYTVTYSATDAAGNGALAERSVTVSEPEEEPGESDSDQTPSESTDSTNPDSDGAGSDGGTTTSSGGGE